MIIKNLTITQQIGYLALASFVCAVIFISLYFVLDIPKYMKAPKKLALPVANKPCELCNKHMECLVEPSRNGTKPCPYYQEWETPKYYKPKVEEN